MYTNGKKNIPINALLNLAGIFIAVSSLTLVLFILNTSVTASL